MKSLEKIIVLHNFVQKYIKNHWIVNFKKILQKLNNYIALRAEILILWVWYFKRASVTKFDTPKGRKHQSLVSTKIRFSIVKNCLSVK